MRVEPRDASGLVGRKLGEFIVREPMSSGGFGLVFRAEQPALGREAVIKVLHARLRGSETVIQRFLREAKLASRLDHPYAAHIYAFGAEPDGLLWIAMELVRGTPLDKLLEARGAIALERFVPLIERICQVVQTAHEQGIVHRDLKPANVMVLVRAGQLLPKLLDLGIAKLDGAEPEPSTSGSLPRAPSAPDGVTASLADTAAPETTGLGTPPEGRLTEDGAVIGSPLYMAPEQWMDAAAADARTDLYALGILSYESLTGRPPFSGANRIEIATAHAAKPPPKLGNQMPPALDAVIAKVLSKKPGERYATALEFAAAFRTASGIAAEVEQLPRLDERIRIDAITRAPEPIARAVAAFDSSRNAHQARDALWQFVRVASRFVGVIALAAHSQVGSGGRISGLEVTLRRLLARTTADSEWFALARELSAPFDKLRAAYPMPELLELLAKPDVALEALIALREDDKAVDDEHVRALLEIATPLVGSALVELGFLGEYQLAVTTAQGAERWIGLAGQDRATFSLRSSSTIEPRQVVFVDATGVPAIALHPFVQVSEPAPGMAPQLFMLEGRGRRGTRLVALPDAFEMEDEALHEVLGGLLGDSSDSLDRSNEEVCPFPGLSAFTAQDATRFFGRERETEAFVNRLRATAFVAVVGPSGAGKSSFVQAGVVPALPDDWRVVVVRPGSSPLASLSARLAGIIDPRVLRAELDRSPDALGTLLRSRQEPGTTLLVIDQFEELFTLCDDPSERERFAETLVRAARSAEEPVRVVITLRDDFLIAAEGLPALRSRITTGLQLLTTPGAAELRRIFLEPLRQTGYTLDDPSLADDVTTALETTRTPLALLSFTCSKLWELRDRRFRQISRKAYASLGGVGGALAKHAEGVLSTMRPDEQRVVREVFRHAVTADGTRAVLAREELAHILGREDLDSAVSSTVEKLIAARLLVSAESPEGGEQIEITHEALIVAWPRLVGWRTEDAEGARLRDQLRAAAKQWDERGRSDGLVWRGDALAEYRLWRQRHPGGLGALETAFAEASLAHAKRAGRRRLQLLVGGFTVLAAGIIALVLLNARVASQRARAQENEELAQSSARIATDSAAKLRKNLVAQYEDTGRRYVIGGDPLAGLAYLDKARELGAKGAGHDLVVALAAAAVSNRELTLTHDAEIRMAAFAPDGSRIVTGGSDDRGRLWDRNGTLIADLPHKGRISSVSIDPDSKFVALAGFDGTASVWDVRTGALRGRMETGDTLQGVVLGPDGRLVTVAANDRVKLWTVEGQLVATLQAAAHPTAGLFQGRPMTLSPDGKRVAVGDSLGTLRIWDLVTQQRLFEIRAHSQQINSVTYSRDGLWIVTSSNDNTARVIDATRGVADTTLRHQHRVAAAAISPDGRLIATGSFDRTAVIWDRATGTPVRTMRGHTGAINDVTFRGDGSQLATCSDDRTAALWDVASGRRDVLLIGHEGGINVITYDRSGQSLLTAAADGAAIVWGSRPPLPIIRREGDRSAVFTLEYSPDSKRIVTGGEGGKIHVWDRATGVEQFVAHATDEGVYRARFSPDGKYIMSVSGANAHVWDAQSGAEIGAFKGHTEAINDGAWLPDSSQFATAGGDGSLRIWKIGAATPVRVFTAQPVAAFQAVDVRGTQVVASASDRMIRVWDVGSGALVHSWSHPEPIWSIELSPDGERILGSSRVGARIWSAIGQPIVDLRIKGGDIVNARWAASGDVVMTSSFDGTVRLWEASTGNELAVFDAGIETVTIGAIAPDDGSVASATLGGSATVWALPKRDVDLAALKCAVPFAVGPNGLEKTRATCSVREALHLK